MSNTRSAMTLLVLLPAVAFGQTAKRPAPKILEEERDGETIRVMLLAPGDSVSVGVVKYTFPPLELIRQEPGVIGDRGGFSVPYTIANVGPKGQSVKSQENRLEWIGWKHEGEQNETMKGAAESLGDKEL